MTVGSSGPLVDSGEIVLLVERFECFVVGMFLELVVVLKRAVMEAMLWETSEGEWLQGWR